MKGLYSRFTERYLIIPDRQADSLPVIPKVELLAASFIALKGVEGDADLSYRGAGAQQVQPAGEEGAVGGDDYLKVQFMGDGQQLL